MLLLYNSAVCGVSLPIFMSDLDLFALTQPMCDVTRLKRLIRREHVIGAPMAPHHHHHLHHNHQPLIKIDFLIPINVEYVYTCA